MNRETHQNINKIQQTQSTRVASYLREMPQKQQHHPLYIQTNKIKCNGEQKATFTLDRKIVWGSGTTDVGRSTVVLEARGTSKAAATVTGWWLGGAQWSGK